MRHWEQSHVVIVSSDEYLYLLDLHTLYSVNASQGCFDTSLTQIMPPQVESLLEQGNLLSEKDAGSSRHDLFLGAVAALTQTARRLWQPFASRQTTKLRPTAYLDGMRGFAALLVYILHNETWAHESLRSDTIFENGFGYHKQYYFACFPGIRLLFSGGHLSVAIFFVLSGYVLALKPLRILLINNDHAQLSAALASALFRRWIRLFIPLIITSFIFMTLNYIIPNLSKIKPENAYHDEAFKWYAEFKEFSFIFRMVSISGSNHIPFLFCRCVGCNPKFLVSKHGPRQPLRLASLYEFSCLRF
jgi:hypothetical protein